MAAPTLEQIADAVRVLRQIRAVNELGLVAHLWTRAASSAEREAILPDENLTWVIEEFLAVAPPERKAWFVHEGNQPELHELLAEYVNAIRHGRPEKGQVTRAIDHELRRFAQRQLPQNYAADIRRRLEPLLGRKVDSGLITRRKQLMFGKRRIKRRLSESR